MIRPGSFRGPFAAWAGAATLIASVAADAVNGRWLLLPLLVAGFYGGILVVDLLARPLLGRSRVPYLVGAGVLRVAVAVTLVATAPLWLDWTLWYSSTFLRAVGAVFLLLSVVAPAWATRKALLKKLLRARPLERHPRYLGNPPRDAATVILLGTALLTLNWGILLLASLYLLRSLLPPHTNAPSRGGSPLKPSIVIPTLNEQNNIGLLLSDLELQTRKAHEVIVVDGKSTDGTGSVVKGFPEVKLLEGFPPVAEQRNLGGREAGGDVLIFLDADVRLEKTFLEEFLRRFECRNLGVACSFYMPPRRSPARIKAVYALCSMFFALLQDLLPSGSGQCFAIRAGIFRANDGFDTALKVAEDIELIRRLARRYRFGVIPRSVRVSDRRFKENGVLRMSLLLVAMSVIFTIGYFKWANLIEYEFGNHKH